MIPIRIRTDGGELGVYLIEDSFGWTYENTFEKPASNIPGTGHPPLATWVRGQFGAFPLSIIVVSDGGANYGLGWSHSSEEVIQSCEKLAKACLPKKGKEAIGMAPDRWILEIGNPIWFKVLGVPENIKITFEGPWEDSFFNTPHLARVSVQLWPCSKAKKESDADRWVINNESWNFKSLN